METKIIATNAKAKKRSLVITFQINQKSTIGYVFLADVVHSTESTGKLNL